MEMGTVSMWLFLAALILGLATFAYVAYYRIRILALGGPATRTDQPVRRAFLAIKYAILQYRMPQELSAGLLHIFIFGGFMVLSVRTIVIFGMGFAGADFNLNYIPVIGPWIGPLYAIAKEVVVTAVLIGCVGFAWRRLVSKPTRMKDVESHAEAVVILGWIAGLMLADMFLEAGLHAAGHNDPAVFHVPSWGALLAPLFSQSSGQVVWEAMVWTHSVMVLIFLNYLPFGKHFHVITAIPNVYLARISARGRLRPIENMEELFEKMEEDPSLHIGYQNVEHYTWKEILDLYSCTECGRCVPQCPAWATDKPLSLKRVNKESKHHLYERAPYLLGKKDGEYEGPQTAGGAVLADTIWACTLCGDCEERCPVLIEQVPRIVDLRRHLAMMEGNVPTELNNTFRGWERNSNPWGLGYDSRGDWIDENVQVKTLAENPDVEYLFYVGCMGSFDDRSTRVTKAVIKLLNAAGVSFGVLGVEEQCCGETARRLGNEFLGQMVAQANVEVLKGYNVKKVIAFCPHCFNTLKNEYSDFDMQFEEVWHAADFVKKLISDGKLKIKKNGTGNVAYHDSCFLGRYNDIYEQPRELIQTAGGTVVNPSLTRSKSFCCGAGGGRMWMEEEQPRVNDMRFKEIWESCGSPETIGVSCPYCLTMLLDGSKNANKEEDVQVRDVLEILADNLEA